MSDTVSQEQKFYRVVADYGFGDVTWLERGLTAEQAIQWWYERTCQVITEANMESAEDPIYRIEEDNEDDEQPDTFLDS